MVETVTKRQRRSLALIGYGAMGSHVFRTIMSDKPLHVSYVVVPPVFVDEVRSQLPADTITVGSVDDIQERVDLVLECAGHEAVMESVPKLLRRGINTIIASVGALSRRGVPEMLEAAASEGHSQLTLVPGAIAGVDALAAARQQGLSSVMYTGRKSPLGWKGTEAEKRINLDLLKEATIIFEGSAREAAQHYPKNANVAAMIGLAGLGLDQTRVSLIADPSTTCNNHEIMAHGDFGELNIRTSNHTLPSNPKTSMLAALSIIRAVRNQVAAIVI